MKNTFAIFYEWMEEKELDIQAMLNCLNSYSSMRKHFNNLNEEINSKQNKKNDLEQGKKSFLDKMLRRSSENLIAETNNKINALTDESNILGRLCDIIEHKFFAEIYPFVDELKQSFYDMILKFNETQRNNSIINKELWQEVVI